VNAESSVRLDKWLWSIRLFKTRTLAANACKSGHVTIAGLPAKPSREVKIGDVVMVVKEEMTRRFKVLQPLGTRVGAQKVPEFAEDQTPPEELQKPRTQQDAPFFTRPKGAGRPTKKDRRLIDNFEEKQGS
jgi:ribosome-associated heat shock protein Hsp15